MEPRIERPGDRKLVGKKRTMTLQVTGLIIGYAITLAEGKRPAEVDVLGD